MTEPSAPTPAPAPAHEQIEEIVTTDPGPQQDTGQGEDTPAQDAPEGEPGFA